MSGAIVAGARGLITLILVGPATKIAEIARKHGIDLGCTEIVDVPHGHASAPKAVELVRQGRGEEIMKGCLHTDELLSEAVARETGLRNISGSAVAMRVAHARRKVR